MLGSCRQGITVAHLQEQLHVLVEYEGPTLMRDTTLSNAEMLVRAVLTPAAEGMPGQGHAVSQYDMLKQQMQQTFGAAAFASPQLPGAGLPGAGMATVANVPNDPGYVGLAVAGGQIVSMQTSNTETGGGQCKTTVKVYVPQRTVMGESRGKLLGTRGSTLKQLIAESGCQMAIRGRGSSKSEDMKPPHLQEQMHVLVEYEGPALMRDTAVNKAEMLIRAVLTPLTDPQPGQHAVSQFEAMQQQVPPSTQTSQPAPQT